jgi:hypothetical protein
MLPHIPAVIHPSRASNARSPKRETQDDIYRKQHAIPRNWYARLKWGLWCGEETDECDPLPDRAVFDKSANHLASSARCLVIEAMYRL